MDKESLNNLDEILELKEASSLESMTLPSSREKEEPIHGVVIGSIDRVFQGLKDLEVFVSFPGNPAGKSVVARTLSNTPLSEGDEIALMFESGDPYKPLIVGPIKNPSVSVQVDSETPENINLKAKEKITLSCGRASITLTKAGKILLRGAYISSRSSGANKVKGASVQIN